MNKYFYSAKNKGFYHGSLIDEYKKSSGGWPDDAVEVNNEDYASLLVGQSEGKNISSDNDGYPILTEKTAEQIYSELEEKQRSLLSEAARVIAPLQDAADLGIITIQEQIKLTSWKKYRVMLNRLDFENELIEWPEKPS